MVENRKLFYAISLMLLTCCQIITMLPHNVANVESSSTIQSSNSTENNNNNHSITTELKENNSSSSFKRNNNSSSNSNSSSSSNNNDSDDFLIIATATTLGKKLDHHHAINTSKGVWESGERQENDSRITDNIDDLIFLDKRPINQQHHHHQHHQREQKENQLQHQQQNHHRPHHIQHNLQENEHNHYKFHHITMDVGNSNSNSNSDEDIDSLTDTTYSTMIIDDDEQEPEHDGAIPHEIELQPDINEEVTPLNVTPLDLSDFLSLIPAAKVKAIVNHYYHNDPEVQRAHAFMSSQDFLMLKQHIIAIPEMSAFLRYLNNSGLDLVKFVTALTNLTAYNSEALNSTKISSDDISAAIEVSGDVVIADTTTPEINDIEFAQKQSITIPPPPPTISNIETQITTMTIPTATITDDMNETTTATETIAKEQLNGLHGLVDSVLDVLPQDQILATFFDKLEANEQFSKLVDNIGSPEFAKVLNNMQNSIPLRNLIFTLHNNGIYVIRIVDSLKSYFFLGGF